jgi:hypothetical protein
MQLEMFFQSAQQKINSILTLSFNTIKHIRKEYLELDLKYTEVVALMNMLTDSGSRSFKSPERRL